jgi:hypothetical protein
MTPPEGLQPTFAGGDSDAFVTKLNAKASRLLFSTFVGGSGHDGAHDGELGRAGSFYLDGPTDSTDFPVTRARLPDRQRRRVRRLSGQGRPGQAPQGSGQQTGSVTVASSGPRAGLARDRIARR